MSIGCLVTVVSRAVVLVVDWIEMEVAYLHETVLVVTEVLDRSRD